MKKINIDFYPDNLELIYELKKTSTLRSESQSKKIGLVENETGIFQVRDRFFLVTCLGLKMINEVGGKVSVWDSEGFNHTGGPKFKQTELFLDGKIPLFFYKIELV